MSDYIHPTDLQATLAAIINVQECFSEMYRICTHTIAEQRRTCAQILQILDTPIRLRRRRRVRTRPGRTSGSISGSHVFVFFRHSDDGKEESTHARYASRRTANGFLHTFASPYAHRFPHENARLDAK